MNADRLLALYEKVAEAPDAVPRLRRFVLDLAVRGKLVAQDARDEPASELLKRIAAEKARLVKEGEIKKPKLLPEMSTDEQGFLAPLGWTWSRLGGLTLITQGFAFSSGDYSKNEEDGPPLIKIGDIGSNSPEVFIKGAFDASYLVKPGELLLGLSGSIKCARWEGPVALLNQRIARILPTIADLTDGWLFLAVDRCLDKWKSETSKLTVQNIKAKQLTEAPVPLPPLAEQRRIVVKVEELMALLDRLEAARSAREATRDRLTAASFGRLTASDTGPDTQASSEEVETGFPSSTAQNTDFFPANARFALATLPALTTRPDQIKPLRQTILNLAVRGALATNITDEEPVEMPTGEQKVRRGVPDEVAEPEMVCNWSLPSNWRKASIAEMLRSGLLIDLKDGNHGANHPKKADYVDDGPPFIAAAHVRDHQIDYDAAPKLSAAALKKIRIGYALSGDVVFTHKATIGRVAIAERDCILTPQTTYYRVNAKLLLNSYLMRVLESSLTASQYADVVKQTTRDFLPIARQYNLFVPLPSPRRTTPHRGEGRCPHGPLRPAGGRPHHHQHHPRPPPRGPPPRGAHTSRHPYHGGCRVMPIQHSVWVVSDEPSELSNGSLPSEQLLEDMIIAEPRILSSEWMIIGRQVDTGLGGRIDLLCIAPDGTLVLVELKRDRTPREVVAQALDYASWVEGLDAEDIAAIYGRFRPGQSLGTDFLARFGQPLDDDTINESHQVVIVAATLDDSSERIVSYLNDRGVAINVLFFQVFDHASDQLLSRAWLIDPSEVQVQAASVSRRGEKEPWNGEYYASFGTGETRLWDEAVKYGFVSGGGGAWYSNSLRMLHEGDRIWTKVPGKGFVGVGEVTGPRVAAKDFEINGSPALEVLQGNYHRQCADNPEESEYFVPVKWLKTVDEAKRYPRGRHVRKPEYGL